MNPHVMSLRIRRNATTPTLKSPSAAFKIVMSAGLVTPDQPAESTDPQLTVSTARAEPESEKPAT